MFLILESQNGMHHMIRIILPHSYAFRITITYRKEHLVFGIKKEGMK